MGQIHKNIIAFEVSVSNAMFPQVCHTFQQLGKEQTSSVSADSMVFKVLVQRHGIPVRNNSQMLYCQPWAMEHSKQTKVTN